MYVIEGPLAALPEDGLCLFFQLTSTYRSHGNVSHHVQAALDPRIDASQFRVYSGFGQQLGPIVFFGAAGVIDALAGIYPKTVTKLFKLASQRPITDENLKQIQELQYKVSAAEEYIVKTGILGIREGIYRELGIGNLEGGRLPLRGKLPDGEWEKWTGGILGDVVKIEKAI